MRRRFMKIEEATRYPCCDDFDVETRHAGICPRSGARVKQLITMDQLPLTSEARSANTTLVREI